MISADNQTHQSQKVNNQQFMDDVLAGLRSEPKRLQSKYFYDAEGDRIFQQIMNSPEYYVAKCEMEIFTEQTQAMAKMIGQDSQPFDLIELGAGDATKSVHLLKHLQANDVDFTYLPIDISGHVIQCLEDTLPKKVPGLKLTGLTGEYFDMLAKASGLSNNRKVVLFLGTNIGNMPSHEAKAFLDKLREHLSPGDMVIMGADLKKNPRIIRAAYDDAGGYTKAFNLNLLTRINRELNADFDINQFDHYCNYDPENGSCKSYLISLHNQQVHINGQPIRFNKDEFIWMEISQKYTVEQIDRIATDAGFTPLDHLFDSKQWYVDTVLLAE